MLPPRSLEPFVRQLPSAFDFGVVRLIPLPQSIRKRCRRSTCLRVARKRRRTLSPDRTLPGSLLHRRHRHHQYAHHGHHDEHQAPRELVAFVKPVDQSDGRRRRKKRFCDSHPAHPFARPSAALLKFRIPLCQCANNIKDTDAINKSRCRWVLFYVTQFNLICPRKVRTRFSCGPRLKSARQN
jgi:hypothetical protein